MARIRRREFIAGSGAVLGGLACTLGGEESLGAPIVREAARVRFAAIGDYGIDADEPTDVAALVRGFDPEFIITLGDNNYPHGRASTLDDNVGRHYHDFIHGYTGRYGSGSDIPRFFPTLGNHDWRTPEAAPYREYFKLPGRERYYDVRWGPVHLFAIDSDRDEPDGCEPTSRQAMWLRDTLAASTAPWRIVYFHHPPYSSGRHGSTESMRWPFFEWGATAVMSGHDHTYERVHADNGLYLVNGLGGHPHRYDFRDRPVTGSQIRFQADHGALRVDADYERLELAFVTRAGDEIDRIVL